MTTDRPRNGDVTPHPETPIHPACCSFHWPDSDDTKAASDRDAALMRDEQWKPDADTMFRFESQDLDLLNYRDLLRSVARGEVVFLDNPRDGGDMVGFVLKGCEEVLLRHLNLGLDADLDDDTWRAHDYLDWFQKDGVPAGNLITLIQAVADDSLEGIVDHAMGGIVAYTFYRHTKEVVRVLNHTNDQFGTFARISRVGDIFPSADFGGPGQKPKATHWYWSTGNAWCAVVDEWETGWWEGAAPEDIAARPENWALPIWELPPSGTLVFQYAIGEGFVDQEIAITPAPVLHRVQIPVEFIAHYQDGEILRWVVLPLASHAGYFEKAAFLLGDHAVELDVDSTDGPFWKAVQAALASANPIPVHWEE